jgi:hypothetical protein
LKKLEPTESPELSEIEDDRDDDDGTSIVKTQYDDVLSPPIKQSMQRGSIYSNRTKRMMILMISMIVIAPNKPKNKPKNPRSFQTVTTTSMMMTVEAVIAPNKPKNLRSFQTVKSMASMAAALPRRPFCSGLQYSKHS